MTLFRQLLVFTLILFFLLFTGTWMALIEGTRTFLSEQLSSHAQDTATSFGLSITPHIAEGDMATVETMMNAVFDRGYYKNIRLVDVQGLPVIERSMDIVIEGVPGWFIKMVPLDTPIASTTVMAGWNQAGTVYVESNPGYAYKEFWSIAVMMTVWFLLLGIVVAILGGLGIRYLLRPLHRLEQQADALAEKRYIIQEKLPRTRELKSVVSAMNNMTLKVKSMFENQAAVARRLQQQAYRDELTGLGNRRFFEGQIRPRLERKESNVKGGIMLVQVKDLKAINDQRGYESGDKLLQRVAEILQAVVGSYSKSAVAHLSGADFGIFIPDITVHDAEQVAEDIVRRLPQVATEGLTLTENVGHVGVVVYKQSTSLGILLSAADNQLRSAQQGGPNKWSLATYDDSGAEAIGQQQWKATLQEVLNSEQVELHAQSVVQTTDHSKLLHKEVFSRVRQADGSLVSAGVFMPLAERLGLVSKLDRIVLQNVLRAGEAGIETQKVAVNISMASLEDETFEAEVIDALQGYSQQASRIVFEFVEFSAVQNLDRLVEFGTRIRQYGHGLALDHFGSSFSNFGYLQSLRPDYVKIDRAFTSEIGKPASDSEFFISSLCSVAHSLDISVISEGVETAEQANALLELGIDGIQGYFIDRPGPLVAA